LSSNSSSLNSTSSNATTDWATVYMPLDSWNNTGQQTIGCPKDEPCCIKLPVTKLTSTAVVSYEPTNTFVCVPQGAGEYKTAGTWALAAEASGDMEVCSFESNQVATQKPTVLTIPPRTYTAVGSQKCAINPNRRVLWSHV
jgi:hypothetical protein